MLASIHPLGERARGQSFAVTVTAYTIGSFVGAATFGALLGALGAAVFGDGGDGFRLGILAGAAVLAALVDRSGRRIPSSHRQVNEDWLTEYRGWVYGLGFGLQLGLGVVTIVTTAAVYLTWVGALLSARPGAGAVIGVAFGAARALPVLAGGRLRTPAAVGARGRALESAAGRFAAVTVVAELVVAVGALTLVVGR